MLAADLGNGEAAAYLHRQPVGDFGMARHRLDGAGGGVAPERMG